MTECIQALEVKEGAFGLGLFLLEPAKAGDLIGGARYESLLAIGCILTFFKSMLERSLMTK
jgi:hypothetical protein